LSRLKKTDVISRYPVLKHFYFWLAAFVLLTYIYGTAYENFELGVKVILLLLPVHLLYFYLVDYIVVRHFYIKGQYLKAFLMALAIMLFIAFFYRVVEIFITDPYIYQFYKARNANFTWASRQRSAEEQIADPILFVTAIERSNAVVWIGITLRLFTLSHERKQSALQAELSSLKAQLHPHFLFNSLNNIYSLSLEKSEKTPEVVLGISNILRYSLYECTAQQVSLKRDIEILRDYIKLEKIRYEERLELNLFIADNTQNLQIAPLLMLPLVENAFKHGTAATIDTPWINIQLRIQGNHLTLNISNSKPETTDTTNNTAGKIGIENVRKRLQLLYPGRYSLDFFDEEDCFITLLNIDLL